MHFIKRFVEKNNINHELYKYSVPRISDLAILQNYYKCEFCGIMTNFFDKKFIVVVCSDKCRNHLCKDL